MKSPRLGGQEDKRVRHVYSTACNPCQRDWLVLIDGTEPQLPSQEGAPTIELNQHVWRDSVDSNHDKKVNSLP